MSDSSGGVYNLGQFTWNGGKLTGNDAGLGANGGGIDNSGSGTAYLYGVNIQRNSAGVGGGFYVDGGNITLDSCTLSNNKAQTAGAGGAWKAPGSYTVTGGTITDPIVQVT